MPSSKAYILDFSSESEIFSTLEKIQEEYGIIDALIYNIALYPWKSISSLTLKEWQETLNLTLTGAFLATKACLEGMKKQHFEKLVFLSSVAGENLGLPNMSAYTASKSGLNGFMRTAALELAHFNINVNSISPGKVYDPSQLTKEEIFEKIQSIPLKRFITPDDIAHMVEFLLSANAQNITGQNFIIDGGQCVS